MSKKSQQTREKFTKPQKSKTPYLITTGILTLGVILGSYFLLGNNSSPLENKAIASTGQTVKYSSNEKLQQVKVTNRVENGSLTVTTMADLQKQRFIYTEYQANGKRVPVTAFIQPSGKVLVGVSLCEPCKSESFHITGNQIICNACGTVWDLQTLKGISGGCQDYPPEALSYSLNGDKIQVPQSVLDTWKPRV